MIAVVRILGEYRLEHVGLFVGCSHPDSDARLVLAEEAVDRAGADRDSLGFVFASRGAATTALAHVNNTLWRFRL